MFLFRVPLVAVLIIAFTNSLYAVPAPKASSPSMFPMPSAQPVPPTDRNAVVATVNGKKITEGQVMDRLRMMIAGPGSTAKINPAKLAMIRQIYGGKIIDTIVSETLVAQDAKKAGITVTDKELNAKLDEIKQQIMKNSGLTEAQLDKKIQESRKITLKQFMNSIKKDPSFRDSLLLSKVLHKKYPKGFNITDAEIKAYYDKNLKKEFTVPETVRASHILIDTRKAKTAEAKAAAKRKAEKILKEAQQKGADFAALAKKYSDGPSKTNGGDLGYFPRHNAMVEPFAAAAFKLKPGQICDKLVETQFGYHIIKVTGKKPGRVIPFSEAKAKIKTELINKKEAEYAKKYIASLKKNATITYPTAGKNPAGGQNKVKIKP